MSLKKENPAVQAGGVEKKSKALASSFGQNKTTSATGENQPQTRDEKRASLTQEKLHELVIYDPATGKFFARKDRLTVKVGDELGTPRRCYIVISLLGVEHYAHRLAWLYVFGHWPNPFVDHVNGDGNDNRIANLRVATNTQNNWNRPAQSKNSSGRTGVYLEKNRWKARIGIAGRWITLGSFSTFKEAVAVREAAEVELIGQTQRGAA